MAHAQGFCHGAQHMLRVLTDAPKLQGKPTPSRLEYDTQDAQSPNGGDLNEGDAQAMDVQPLPPSRRHRWMRPGRGDSLCDMRHDACVGGFPLDSIWLRPEPVRGQQGAGVGQQGLDLARLKCHVGVVAH